MKDVAVAMPLIDHYEHGIARGIVRYARQNPEWRLHGASWMFASFDGLNRWEGHGVISRAEFEDSWNDLVGFQGARVDVAHAFASPAVTTVCNDDTQTGRLAAHHLASRGFQRFAFVGAQGTLWSNQRLAGFQDEIGYGTVAVFERPLQWWLQPGNYDDLLAFLSGIRFPAGLLAANDKAALRVSALCQSLDIAVPQDLSIVGVDNEDIPCELSNPPLTSILLDLESIGYRAAQALDAAMNQRSAAGATFQVAPIGLVERRSTHTFVADHPLAARVFATLREPGGHRLNVKELAIKLATSRRTVETRIREATGKTAHELIIERRILYAMDLLLAHDDTVESVARNAGFPTLQRFYHHFKEATHQTPGQFRAAHTRRKV